MNILDAFEIVIDLARQSVAAIEDDPELKDEVKRQRLAIAIAHAFTIALAQQPNFKR